ncbi:MAG: sugar phosphate isomerase/epimerase [Gemmataceae bacterium]|nr:sugar phosphate isomerase/epimerase [Gemmataceae bacterium]
MFVACSTLCFGRFPLDRALRVISELEFTKIDVAIHECGPHLKPSEVAADVNRYAQRIRIGSSLSPAAFSVDIEAPDTEEYQRQLRALCRLARLSTVPVLSIAAASSGSGIDAEVDRLTPLVKLAEAEGVTLTLETRIGTLTESPGTAVELCERVAGLGLTLDPSHYIAGPNQAKSYDAVFPFVRHVRLRDSGRSPEQFQLRVGQGEIEYGRIVTQLCRFHYDLALSVDIRDIPDAPFPMEPEVRKLKYLLESLV